MGASRGVAQAVVEASELAGSGTSLPFETHRAVQEVSWHHGDMRRLEFDFSHGFGALARDLRTWEQSA